MCLKKAGFEGVEPFLMFDEKQGIMPKNLWAKETLEKAWKNAETYVRLSAAFGILTGRPVAAFL